MRHRDPTFSPLLAHYSTAELIDLTVLMRKRLWTVRSETVV